MTFATGTLVQATAFGTTVDGKVSGSTVTRDGRLVYFVSDRYGVPRAFTASEVTEYPSLDAAVQGSLSAQVAAAARKRFESKTRTTLGDPGSAGRRYA